MAYSIVPWLTTFHFDVDSISVERRFADSAGPRPNKMSLSLMPRCERSGSSSRWRGLELSSHEGRSRSLELSSRDCWRSRDRPLSSRSRSLELSSRELRSRPLSWDLLLCDDEPLSSFATASSYDGLSREDDGGSGGKGGNGPGFNWTVLFQSSNDRLPSADNWIWSIFLAGSVKENRVGLSELKSGDFPAPEILLLSGPKILLSAPGRLLIETTCTGVLVILICRTRPAAASGWRRSLGSVSRPVASACSASGTVT